MSLMINIIIIIKLLLLSLYYYYHYYYYYYYYYFIISMSSIIRQHPVNSIINSDYLKKRKIADDDYIVLDDYHHFDNIRRYLEDLAVTQPNCISRCGRKKKLMCTCCSVFKYSSVACCVAAYLMEFGKQDKNTKRMIVIEWIRHLEMSDDIEGQQPYTLPYFPFSEYEDMLRDEGILSYEVPKNILYNHKVCKTAMMNIIGVGRDFWKSCKLILEHGPEPSLLKNNQHALKKDMADDLDTFFEEMKELSEPIATVVVRNTTKDITKISLKMMKLIHIISHHTILSVHCMNDIAMNAGMLQKRIIQENIHYTFVSIMTGLNLVRRG